MQHIKQHIEKGMKIVMLLSTMTAIDTITKSSGYEDLSTPLTIAFCSIYGFSIMIDSYQNRIIGHRIEQHNNEFLLGLAQEEFNYHNVEHPSGYF